MFLPRLAFRRRFYRECESCFVNSGQAWTYFSIGAFPGLVLALVVLALLSPRSSGQGGSKTTAVTPMEAVLRLHLPQRAGAVTLYYSACCRERGIEIQNAVQGFIAFYRDKLGIPSPLLGVAVLDENDWDHIGQQINGFNPYGLTNYQVAPSGYILFIPADDRGVISKHLLGNRQHETAATLKLFASAHLSYEEAVHRVILQTAYHEAGHTLIIQYGIGPTTHFLNEMLANYFAQAYMAARDPRTELVSKGLTQMRVPPGTYTSLEDFETHYSGMQPANYDWYQLQFGLRDLEIYKKEGIVFLIEIAKTFPSGTSEMSVTDTLSRLEAMSPGFEAWAKRLAEYKPQAAPPTTVRQ
jgi:hypothetical protein